MVKGISIESIIWKILGRLPRTEKKLPERLGIGGLISAADGTPNDCHIAFHIGLVVIAGAWGPFHGVNRKSEMGR
jgi:hypothetical protein